ncbi:unnamed protein product [Rotaria sp. Silwood1]|nr:unnamed protein product [Rotaria sp. Silwood1]CAF4718950.1 unnamed protein product [Rotaria sp. Silwood1]
MMIRIFLLFFCPLIVSTAPLPYAEWAHYHMVWLHNLHTNQVDIQAMFDGYLEHHIPVGIVNIDSRWESNFNTFIFDSEKFPNIRQMLDNIRAKDVHIVLWMTSFVNIDSPNYEYAQDHGYLFNKTLKWWHGEGRLLDYFNENAVNWWHSQIERLLDTVGPIHAFKADESDRYIEKLHDPRITWLKYRTAYYNDTFQILRRLIGPDALIMSRPVDDDLEWSPREIVFMGWVGDEDGTYKGLQTALRYMLESGRRGYVGFGSDIGGYGTDSSAGPLGRTKELFLRWTAVGALSSFMENGGGGEHLPWKFDDETVDIYRSWVNLHYSLIPYLYTQGTKAALYRNGTLMLPCKDIECLLTHAYFLGPSVYVVPVLRDPTPHQTQLIWLPSSPTGKWVSGFNASITHKAHSFIHEDTSRLDRIPFYVQLGTLMPMYDLEQSQGLDAYKFVLWGEITRFDQPLISSLFTRDGQEWILELDYIRKRLTTRFVQWHKSNDDQQLATYTWQFCQYISEQSVCFSERQQLRNNSWLELDSLVYEKNLN